MKVLEKGTKSDWGMELICTGKGNSEEAGACGAKLLVGKDDIFRTEHHDYGGGCDIYYTFECPCCKSWTDIPSSKLPGHIRQLADKRVRCSSDRNRNND